MFLAAFPDEPRVRELAEQIRARLALFPLAAAGPGYPLRMHARVWA